jgi:hypothetical protein
MLNGTRLNLFLFFAIAVSTFGSFATLLLASSPSMGQENISWRKPLVGSVFSLICITGIIATFFPEKCTQTFHPQRREKEAIDGTGNFALHRASIALKGHHPDCGKFSAHTILVDGRLFCAACAGLLLGGIVALIGTGFYFFVDWDLRQVGFWYVLAGQAGVFLGFIQLKFTGCVRLVVNSLFVFGAFLTLVSTDKLVANLFVDLYLIGLIIFWLWTRIIISQWDHQRICSRCQVCGEN